MPKTAGKKRTLSALLPDVSPTLYWSYGAVPLRTAYIIVLSEVPPASEAAARDVGARTWAATNSRSKACESYTQAMFDASKKLLSADDRARVEQLQDENMVVMPALLDDYFSALDGPFVESWALILSKCAAKQHVANCGHYRSQHDALSSATGGKTAVIDMALCPVFCVPEGDGSPKDTKKYKGGCKSLTAELKKVLLGINGKMIGFIRKVLKLPLLRVAVNHMEVELEDVKNALGGVEVIRVHHYRFYAPVRAAPKKPSEFPSRGVDGGKQNSAYLATSVGLVAPSSFGGDKAAAYAALLAGLPDAVRTSHGLHAKYTEELDSVKMTIRGADYAYYNELVVKFKDPKQRVGLTPSEVVLAEACIAGHGTFETRAAHRIEKGEDPHVVAAHYQRIRETRSIYVQVHYTGPDGRPCAKDAEGAIKHEFGAAAARAFVARERYVKEVLPRMVQDPNLAENHRRDIKRRNEHLARQRAARSGAAASSSGPSAAAASELRAAADGACARTHA